MDRVDSDGIGRNQPFSGHARSASTSPVFFGGSPRTTRDSPRLVRSISNVRPGWTPFRRRSSAGGTIRPFEETVLFMGAR